MSLRVILYFGLLSYCSVTLAQAKNDDHNIENELKYSVAYCLSKTYPDSTYSSDAGRVAGSYIQKGRFGIHVYEAIQDFVGKYRKKKYVSKHGNNLDIMQCLDLYNLESLEITIRQAARK